MSDNKVVDFQFYKRMSDNLKAQGRAVDDNDLDQRMARIKASIDRIDALMEELKKGPPSSREKKE
jgi:hypothetical protein